MADHASAYPPYKAAPAVGASWMSETSAFLGFGAEQQSDDKADQAEAGADQHRLGKAHFRLDRKIGQDRRDKPGRHRADVVTERGGRCSHHQGPQVGLPRCERRP